MKINYLIICICVIFPLNTLCQNHPIYISEFSYKSSYPGAYKRFFISILYGIGSDHVKTDDENAFLDVLKKEDSYVLEALVDINEDGFDFFEPGSNKGSDVTENDQNKSRLFKYSDTKHNINKDAHVALQAMKASFLRSTPTDNQKSRLSNVIFAH